MELVYLSILFSRSSSSRLSAAAVALDTNVDVADATALAASCSLGCAGFSGDFTLLADTSCAVAAPTALAAV